MGLCIGSNCIYITFSVTRGIVDSKMRFLLFARTGAYQLLIQGGDGPNLPVSGLLFIEDEGR